MKAQLFPVWYLFEVNRTAEYSLAIVEYIAFADLLLLRHFQDSKI